jgi:hypothetical protein
MDIDFGSLDSLLGTSARSPRKRSREGDVSDEPAEPAPLGPALEPSVTAEDLIARVQVSLSEAAAIEGYEQGSEAWLLSRRGTQTRLKDGSLYSDSIGGTCTFLPGRLTASNFGTAVGHNKYTKPDELVQDMLWGTVVSNDAMRYGNETEPVACDIFETAMFFLTGGGVSVEHRGLMLACPGLQMENSGTAEPRFEGWCGTSPDGIVHWGDRFGGPPSLLEIKCPSVNRRTFYSERQGNDRFGIPHYYYDQIQGIMGLQHLPDALFVVHLPDRTEVAHYLFNAPYFEELMRGLREFWFGRYLPAAVACAKGQLRRGQTAPDPDMQPSPAAATSPAPATSPATAAAPAELACTFELEDDPEAEASRLIEADLAEAPRASVAVLLDGEANEASEPDEETN